MDDNGDHHTAEVFFEMKTYTACNSPYNKNNKITKTSDRRANEITSAYINKFKKLDKVFA